MISLWKHRKLLLAIAGFWCCSATLAQGQNAVISGKVLWEGKPAEPQPLRVTIDKHVCGKTAKLSPDLMVSPKGEIRNVVLSLKGIRGRVMVPESPLEMDQRACEYVPHVLLVPVGAKVKFLNSDAVLHNVHGTSLNKKGSFNRMTFKKKSTTVEFEYPGVVKVACDFHYWMTAWIVVVDHPYHALTDGQGSFEIPNVPPGQYTLDAWHETLGSQSHPVTVEAGRETEIQIVYSKKT